MNILFYLFSSGAWIAAALVAHSKNPIHSVFYLVLVFCNASALLLMLGMEFFALLQLLVYVGALAVMFLFVVMLLDITYTEIIAHQRGYYPIAVVLLLVFLGVFFLMFDQTFGPNTIAILPGGKHSPVFLWAEWNTLAQTVQNIQALSPVLYIQYVDLLILASLILLVAMIGAVVLTLKKRADAPLPDIFSQHNRNFKRVVYNISSHL
jgi:NADH-quinone oxidoreductase subunit J